MVLCGEIIWQADKARWVSSSPPLLLLPPFPLPRVRARKSPVGLGVIQTCLSGYTSGKMSTLPFDTRSYTLNIIITSGMHVSLIKKLLTIGAAWC